MRKEMTRDCSLVDQQYSYLSILRKSVFPDLLKQKLSPPTEHNQRLHALTEESSYLSELKEFIY